MAIKGNYPMRVEDIPISEDEIIQKMFNTFRQKCASQTINIKKLIKSLEDEGLRETDPRLRASMDRKRKLTSTELDMPAMKSLLYNDISLIAAILQKKLIVPDFQSFCKHIKDIYLQCATNQEGQVATYIPMLANVPPQHWAVSVCTVDGQRYSQGDVLIPFTLQSCCKPLTYALSLQELGADKVHSFVGQEPSGLIFNALELDVRDQPHNPMINPGAIIICGLLQNSFENKKVDEIKDLIMNFIKRMAGQEYLSYNDEVFVSEKSTGFRNYAIAYLMMEKRCFPPTITVEDVLSLYFKSCSIEVNCESMSVIAATLANGGMCPLTNDVVLKQNVVRDALSLMQSCGMYDYSGQFAFQIGLPAKSGVSGGMMLVIPSVMGIGMWSPPLDKLGNSVRCLQFCKELLQIYSIHPYATLGHADPEKEELTKRPGRIQEEIVVRILFAAAKGDIDALQCYYLRGMNMEIRDYGGRTALHEAAAAGHAHCVLFLLENCRVNPNPKDRHGHTPLREAKTFKKDEVVSLLVERGGSL